jgi:hypothetical protein
VPVEMRVPAGRVAVFDRYEMISATLRTISFVDASWRMCPSRLVVSHRSCGSAISSAVTTTGPVGVNPSNDLQRDHCASLNWMSRAVMSFTTV